MLFNEIYGRYYQTVGRILEKAVQGELKREDIVRVVQETAFEESVLTIPQALESGRWPLLKKDLSTPLHHAPHRPLSTLEKRWMKTLMQDERIRLFAPDATGLEDVQPLYPAEAIVHYDRYADGDPYQDEGYIERFHTIMTALEQKRRLRVEYMGQKGNYRIYHCVPLRLEYSAKDDKFRLQCIEHGRAATLNLAGLLTCQLLNRFEPSQHPEPEHKREQVVMKLYNERNALERAMLHFSDLEKQTRRLEAGTYEVTLTYDKEDESEILIRILSFGPMLEVLAPQHMREMVRERIQRQMKLRI